MRAVMTSGEQDGDWLRSGVQAGLMLGWCTAQPRGQNGRVHRYKAACQGPAATRVARASCGGAPWSHPRGQVAVPPSDRSWMAVWQAGACRGGARGQWGRSGGCAWLGVERHELRRRRRRRRRAATAGGAGGAEARAGRPGLSKQPEYQQEFVFKLFTECNSNIKDHHRPAGTFAIPSSVLKAQRQQAAAAAGLASRQAAARQLQDCSAAPGVSKA